MSRELLERCAEVATYYCLGCNAPSLVTMCDRCLGGQDFIVEVTNEGPPGEQPGGR